MIYFPNKDKSYESSMSVDVKYDSLHSLLIENLN